MHRPARFDLAPALTLLLPALLLWGCSEAPVSLKYDAKAAIEDARESRAGVFAADILEKAETSYREGIRAMETESARWSPARDYGPAHARLETALRRARLSVAVAESQRKRLESRVDTLLVNSRASLANLGFLLSYLSPRTRARADLMRAKVLCEEAASLRRRGDLATALVRAERAAQATALLSETLGRIIGRYTSTDRLGTYRRWVKETLSESAASGSYAILVDKLRHTLTLLKAGRPVRVYRADIGLNGAQDKSVAGDKATPEGRYKIVEKRLPHQTRWYKALLLNYPNEQDRAQFEAGQRRGTISKRARIGGLIEIHGEGGRFQDWTDGCVALENDDIDELFDRVSVGTPVTIVGYESDDWLALPSGKQRAVVADGVSPRRASRPRGRKESR